MVVLFVLTYRDADIQYYSMIAREILLLFSCLTNKIGQLFCVFLYYKENKFNLMILRLTKMSDNFFVLINVVFAYFLDYKPFRIRIHAFIDSLSDNRLSKIAFA